MDSLPPALLRSLHRLPGFNEEAFTAVHLEASPPVSVRFNPGKYDPDRLPAELPFVPGSPVKWASGSWYLNERPAFTQDPLFHAGLYYVQEASSMFLEQAFHCCFPESRDLRVLDCCAAPGGKSTQLQSLLSAESLLVSNEVIKSRIPALYQNLVRWGGANVVVSQNDPKDFQRLPGFFDLLVVDAPCSGSGLFRRDPSTADGWSEDLVNLCSQRQQRILADTWSSLKEGGFLIYCTCSFSAQENEAVIDALMTSQQTASIRIPLLPEWNIVETQSEKHGAFAYRFYPDKTEGEGFFLSVIQKISEDRATDPARDSVPRRKNSAEKKIRTRTMATPPAGWLAGGLQFMSINDMCHAVPETQFKSIEVLRSALYLKKAGILCGKAGAGEWIPDHELALAAGAILPSLALSLEDARRYLRKELDSLPGDDRGWKLLTYGGLGLGWIKKLPNRINNYLPSSWRILGKP